MTTRARQILAAVARWLLRPPQRRRDIALPCMVIAALWCALLAIAPHGPLRGAIAFEGDENTYLALAHSLADSNFTEYRVPGLLTDTYRPPVVPALAAMILKVVGNQDILHRVWPLTQPWLLAATACLAMIAARGLGLAVAPRIVALAVAFDGLAIETCERLLTEPTYAFLFALSYAAILAVRRTDGTRALAWCAVAAVALALAALTRPVALLFAPVGVVLLVACDGRPLRVKVARVAVAALLFAIPVGAFAARQHAVHGRWMVSDISTRALYRYWSAQFEAWDRGVAWESVQLEYDAHVEAARAASPESPYLAQRAAMDETIRRVVFAHPLRVLRFLPGGAHRLLCSRGGAEWNTLFGVPDTHSIGGLLREGPRAMLLLHGAELLALLLVYGGALWCVVRVVRRRLPARTLLVLLPVVFHLGLSWGPEATGRFRVPVAPWLIVAAAIVGAPSSKPAEVTE